MHTFFFTQVVPSPVSLLLHYLVGQHPILSTGEILCAENQFAFSLAELSRKLHIWVGVSD